MGRTIIILFMLLGTTFAFGQSLEIGVAQGTAIKVLNLVFLGAKVVGAIVIVMGIIELLVEKESGASAGKKVGGTLKIAGGILLSLSATVILWMIGNDSGAGGEGVVTKPK